MARYRSVSPPNCRTLPGRATGPLDALIERMNQDPNIRVRLNGYASASSDSPSQARRISLFRALSVRTYMMKNGIRSTRIDIHALGNTGEPGGQNEVDVIIRALMTGTRNRTQ